MPRIDKLPRYFDSLDQLATGDILIFQNSSEQSQNTEHAGIIIEQNKTKFLAELKNKKLTLTPLMALTSTVHLFRPRKKYQEDLSKKLIEVIAEHQKKPRNYKNAITCISKIYHEASQTLTNSDENTAKKDYISYFMNSDPFTTKHDLKNYLYNNINFQYLLFPGKKNISHELITLIQQEQARLEKENTEKSKQKAKLIKSKLDQIQGEINSQQDEVTKCIKLLKRMLPLLRINTGFGIKTPTSYLKVLDFARKHSLDSYYFDNDLINSSNDVFPCPAVVKYGYNPILGKLYKKYRKQGYSDEEARFECEPSVTAWLKLHSKASWALGLSTFGLGFLFGSLPHAIRRTQETKTKNETQHEILKKTIELENPETIILENEKLKDNFQYLIRIIRKKHSKVTTLFLNPGSIEINDTIAHALTDALCDNPHIKTIHFEHHSMKDTGMKAIAKILKVNQTITTFYLDSNSISDEDARTIAEAIKTNQTITTLYIKGNSISDTGIQAIAEALKENRTIKTVHFDNNSISDAGMQTFTEALKMNQSITTLHLEHSSRSDMDIQAIAETLKVNHSIKTLQLNYTSINNSGMQTIAEILKNNDSITTLCLELNSISDADAQIIEEALPINKTLKTLDLSHNKLGAMALVHLETALEINTTLTDLKLDPQPPYPHSNSYEKASKNIKTLLRRNLNYENLSKKIHETLVFLEKSFEKENTDRPQDIITTLATLFNDLNELPDFMADNFINKTNKIIHDSFAWFFRLANTSNNFTLLEELLAIFEGISNKCHIAYSAAQFELASFYLSQLSGLEKSLMEKTEKIEFTHSGFKEYVRTLIAYLVHAENYNKNRSSLLPVYPMYELLIKIINSRKIEKNMKYSIFLSLMRTYSGGMELLEKPSKQLIRRYEALIHKIQDSSDTLEVDNHIERLIAAGQPAKLSTSQESHEPIKENNPKYLNLSEKNADDTKAIALSETLRINHTATAVSLEKNKIGAQGAKALAGALKTNQSVIILNLNHNSIGDAGAYALAEALTTNDSITALYLEHNSIGDAGAQALAEALRINKTLQTLDLANNDMMDTKTLSLFAEALRQNNTLETLNLNKSGLSKFDVHILADALKTNHTLRKLDLSNNFLGSESAKIIVELLKINHTLQELNLKNNRVTPNDIDAITEALKTNYTLRELNLENNGILTTFLSPIEALLKRNIRYKNSYDDFHDAISKLNQLIKNQDLSNTKMIEVRKQLSDLLRLERQIPDDYPGIIELKNEGNKISQIYCERLKYLPQPVKAYLR